MAVLEIEGLHKQFKELTVLNNLSLSVEQGSIYGFIGKNGSGKTTTMRIITGLLAADAGSVRVAGQPVTFGETPTNHLVGYLPDVPEYYGFMNALEYLSFCGSITGLTREDTHARATELLRTTGLAEAAPRRIKGYSRGMKQRLGIAQALLHNPLLLICDEPTSALDPVGRSEILDILKAVSERTTIVFSTHILTDVERICDTVGVLEGGRIALTGALDALKSSRARRKVVITVDGAVVPYERFKELEALLLGHPQVQSVVEQGTTLSVELANVRAGSPALLALLGSLPDILVTGYVLEEPSLENLYMEMIS